MIFKFKDLAWIFMIIFQTNFSQDIVKIRLLSENDSTTIGYAHIFLDEKLVAFSSEMGNFRIDMNSNFKTLMIKHLSFQTKEISRTDLTGIFKIYMKENENLLEEIVISVKKNPKHFILLPEKSVKEFFMKSLDVVFPYRLKNAVFVPNDFKNGDQKIINILFETRKGEDNRDTKYIPFIVNLMSVDTITHLPKERIFNEDLAVGKKENQRLLEVDISDYNIEFPKEGIFVVVTLYDKDYYELNGFIERPGFGQTQITKNSKFFELFWYPGSGTWEEPSYSKDRIQCRNFGLEVIQY